MRPPNNRDHSNKLPAGWDHRKRFNRVRLRVTATLFGSGEFVSGIDLARCLQRSTAASGPCGVNPFCPTEPTSAHILGRQFRAKTGPGIYPRSSGVPAEPRCFSKLDSVASDSDRVSFKIIRRASARSAGGGAAEESGLADLGSPIGCGWCRKVGNLRRRPTRSHGIPCQRF